MLDFIHHFLWRKRAGRARSSEDVQAATPPDEDDILDDEEVQELTLDNDSLPDKITSVLPLSMPTSFTWRNRFPL